MNDMSQVKSEPCERCGGLPCMCHQITQKEFTTLQSQLTQAQSGWRTMQEKCERLEIQFAEITIQLTQAHKERDEKKSELAELWSKTETIINDRTKALIQERDEAVAACAAMRGALELINYNTPPLFDVISKVRRALSTNCDKAFIDRMKKLEAKVERYEIVLKDVASDDLDRVSGGIKNAAQYALTPPNSEEIENQDDEQWLDSIAVHWKNLTGKLWETLDGECREEGAQANVSALFEHFKKLQARMKEAEWLLGQPLLCKLNSAPELDEWRTRYAAWLKGGGK